MAIKADDLVKLMKGEACSENLVNLYFKILEKINFMMQQVQTFMKSEKSETLGRPSINDFPCAEKVMYCNSSFIRKLR